MRWPEIQLRYLSKEPISNGLGESGDSRNPLDWPRYIRTTDIKSLLTLHEDRRVTLPPAMAKASSVRKGDILMTAAGATVGKSFQYCECEPACYAGYLVRWRVAAEIASPRFMAYWTESKHFYDQIAAGMVKSTIENFSASKYRSMRAPVPPLDEQRAIADYLDRETQKIDELITEQRGLIETLKERRRSLIDLGAEKASAEQIRLRYLFTPSEVRDCHDERVLSVYRDFGVIPKGSREGNHNVTPEDVSRYLLVRPGDLVVNRMKAWQGSLGVSQYRGIVSGDYEVLRPATDRLLPEFAHLYLRSARMVGRYVVRSTGIRPSQWRLYWKQMADIEIPVPGVQEQQKIVSFVSEQTSRIDELIAESEDLISLSQERRAALITTAVTGQIDVGEAS